MSLCTALPHCIRVGWSEKQKAGTEWCLTSEARSQKTVQLSPCSLRILPLGEASCLVMRTVKQLYEAVHMASCYRARINLAALLWEPSFQWIIQAGQTCR